MCLTRLFLLAAFLAFAPAAFSKGSGGHVSAHSARSTSHGSARSNKCATCARDGKGRIARSPTAVRVFKKTHPCRGNCKDMVVDHIVPLKRGGADSPSHMQWETKAQAKAK